MTRPRLIVIGGSAGAIPSVMEIMRGLPAHFPVPICVVIHFHPDARSVLPMLLESTSGIPAKHPQTQEFLMPRHIYVAPPDHHMVIHKNRILLHRGLHVNRCRPAIDPLFRSAAAAFGPAVIGVLLSGYLDDGTDGLLAIRKEGGRVIIQDPADTPFHDMPRHALQQVHPDFLLSHKDIAAALLTLSKDPAPAMTTDLKPSREVITRPETFSFCDMPQHESYAFSPYIIPEGQDKALHTALWSAVRALDEKIALTRRLMQRAEELNQTLAAHKYQKQIDSTEVHIQLIRQILDRCPPVQRKVGDLD
ncbi:MAG TPA: chemotaxis protein CheB [Oligoflexus sp.]|uniref:chemotaxis protein CheB n=1 Tax=Oligoflexus sp. TaxID=1971216 RepID=UPI002D7EFAB6|nr:chemotaxis protein CheB [Oligoflexus sp.]HET9240054.1 chemotaxis protein CheB [Oligoflexus sp.]